MRRFLLLLCMLSVLVALSACASPTETRSSAATCIGVQPLSTPDTSSTTCDTAEKCLGKTSPAWSLEDFQPQSCGYRKSYGLSSFRGQVTLVVLLSAWCGYCQGQAEKLEKLRLEFELANKKVHILVINSTDAKDDQKKLVDRCSLPLFQDTGDKTWALLKGKKDDFFLYDKDGVLKQYFSSSNPDINTNLSSTEGYNLIKQAIEKLL